MPPTQQAKSPNVGSLSKLAKAKQREFGLITHYKRGYRNREDLTNLPPGVLVPGSQNVLTNTYDRIQVRKGYTLDGAADTTNVPIESSFDWFTSKGYERNLRAGFNTSGSNGKLQYRYDDGSTVTWRDLVTGLSNAHFEFTSFYDFNTEKIDLLLFVNGTSQMYEWSGGITTIASTTINTITKNGSTTWAQEGFLTAGTRSVTINGVVYTYTGGENTTTLTGVAPSPAAEPANSIAHQTPRTTAFSAMTSIPATFSGDLIANLRNQIYVGSLNDNAVYISKVNNYADYSFTSPVRVVGEGAVVVLDATMIGFAPQEDRMYMACGRDGWFETIFTLSSDLAKEAFQIQKLKTSTLQGAQSQDLITKIKNNVAYLSNEPNINTLGRVSGVFPTPQISDLSYPIINDMNGYNFTDGQLFNFRNYMYVAVPQEGLVLIYNMTNPKQPYWEAPQVLPVSRFAIIGGQLYGHSYQTGETYKLFDGYTDNGKSIEANATFSYMNSGVRNLLKSQNAFFVEGYIDSQTTLTLGLKYNTDGCATITSYRMSGNDEQFVCLNFGDASLGKTSLGKRALSGLDAFSDSEGTPPKFRWIPTFPRTDYFEYQPSFSSIGIGQRWEILAFGGNSSLSSNEPVQQRD